MYLNLLALAVFSALLVQIEDGRKASTFIVEAVDKTTVKDIASIGEVVKKTVFLRFTEGFHLKSLKVGAQVTQLLCCPLLKQELSSFEKVSGQTKKFN